MIAHELLVWSSRWCKKKVRRQIGYILYQIQISYTRYKYILCQGRRCNKVVGHSVNRSAVISNLSLHKKYPCSELFWSVFSCIRTECGEIRSISPYSVRMRENTDQNNSTYGHFSLRAVLKGEKVTIHPVSVPQLNPPWRVSQ